MPSFPDLEALNAWLEERCIEQWGQIQHGVLPGMIADVHAEEVGRTTPLGRPFDDRRRNQPITEAPYTK